MVQTKPKPVAASDRKPYPKPKPVPSHFVRKVVTLIRESGYDYINNVLLHQKKEVEIRCHPMASRREIEEIIYLKPINANWNIHSVAYKELLNEN